ncbi:hypothetical protein MKZ38_006851 [Zalerion maritima]|uniref:NAD(P)-binding protein n=1 Tax=Zalerion maritima TaxID=339359 RepID=A0AAD5WN93_9PEZI|nr:hypothetical protein MKZ38_006851 [Zalerion maritima]
MTDVSPLIQSPPFSPLALSKPIDPSSIRLENKTVLITGGASGIGAAIARSWAAYGANVIIADVDDAKGEELVAELRLISSPQARSDGSRSQKQQDGEGKGKGKGKGKEKEKEKEKHHYIHTSVLSFQSLASCFRRTVQDLSPTGQLDVVFANAGIGERPDAPGGLTVPADADALLHAGLEGWKEPQAPDLRVLETNLTGVCWTVHLALFWLREGKNRIGMGDKAILLIGSVASIMALPATPQYTASKHGVLGLFRALRGMPQVVAPPPPPPSNAPKNKDKPARHPAGHRPGIRLNLMLPYFIHTPIIPASGRLLLAGGGTAPVSAVVDAATRLVGDESVAGRALVVGPKMKMKAPAQRTGSDPLRYEQEFELLELPPEDQEAPGSEWYEPRTGAGGQEGQDVGGVNEGGEGGPETRSLWEIYADDYEMTETFLRRFVRLLDQVEAIRGWSGWMRDMARLFVPGPVLRMLGRQ